MRCLRLRRQLHLLRQGGRVGAPLPWPALAPAAAVVATFAAFAAFPAAAAGQALGDPTQPPAVLAAPGSAAAVHAADPAEPAALQLQSILVSREAGGRRIAVINGEVVRAGAKIGDAVVESVGESSVVLRRGKNKQTLRLFPASAGAARTGK